MPNNVNYCKFWINHHYQKISVVSGNREVERLFIKVPNTPLQNVENVFHSLLIFD